MSSETALVRLEAFTAVQIFEPGVIDPVIAQIEAEAKAEAARLDISTEANRKALASLAYKVARSKTFIDTQRKALVADEKKRLKRIDDEGGRIWERLERLQVEVRRPLTEWEELDKKRIADHEQSLWLIESAGPHCLQNWQSMTADAMSERLQQIETDPRDWEEFGQRAAGVKAVTKAQILQAIVKRKTYDAEQAELTRLRAESAERERKEREERIAREATEKAERDARAREEAATREASFQRLKAEARIKEAEREAAEAKDLAERRAKAAVEAERKRVADKEARDNAERDRRDASVRIRKRVLAEVARGLIDCGMSDFGMAQKIAQDLANGVVPHVSVVF